MALRGAGDGDTCRGPCGQAGRGAVVVHPPFLQVSAVSLRLPALCLLWLKWKFFAHGHLPRELALS